MVYKTRYLGQYIAHNNIQSDNINYIFLLSFIYFSLSVGLFSVLDPTVGKITVSGILDIEVVPSNPVTFIVTAYDGLHSDSVSRRLTLLC